jgi:hypothetical protein
MALFPVCSSGLDSVDTGSWVATTIKKTSFARSCDKTREMLYLFFVRLLCLVTLYLTSLYVPSADAQICGVEGVAVQVLGSGGLRTLGKEEESLSEIRKNYPGPVAFANDLDCFPVR